MAPTGPVAGTPRGFVVPVDIHPGARTAPASERGAAVARDGPILLATATDERLALEVQRGNEAAFQIIYERHAGGLRALCRRILRSPEDAEDAFQQALASAWSSLRFGGNPPPRRLKPWLYTVARNRCLSTLRDRGPDHVELDGPSISAEYLDQVDSRAELRAVLVDVGDLPPHLREALVLAQFAGLSHAAVGERLGRRAPTVKSLVFEARSTLAAWREARDTPCNEIREQLATLRGGSLRRRTLRRHLQLCDSCRAFQEAR